LRVCSRLPAYVEFPRESGWYRILYACQLRPSSSKSVN
jgi:hypothetical protein